VKSYRRWRKPGDISTLCRYRARYDGRHDDIKFLIDIDRDF